MSDKETIKFAEDLRNEGIEVELTDYPCYLVNDNIVNVVTKKFDTDDHVKEFIEYINGEKVWLYEYEFYEPIFKCGKIRFYTKQNQKLEGNKMNIIAVKKEIDKNLKDIEKQKHISEFYNSLIRSVNDVGGSVQWITEETTLKELADILAQNNVRFCANSAAVLSKNENDMFPYVADRDQY